jgi:tetratricopeptide (TPR) repeat protein
LLKRALATRLQESGAKHPDTVRILSNLTALRLVQEKFKERGTSMSSGLFGENPAQTFQQMVALMNQQRWAEAVKKGQSFVDSPVVSSRDRASVYHNMGFCYNQLGHFAEAERQYEEAARRDSGNSDLSLTLWFNRANNQQQWGKSLKDAGNRAESQAHFQQAMNYARKAREIDPSDSDTRRLIVSIQSAMGTQ